MKFEKWMNAIDKACLARFMVSIYDLPDQDFQGYFKEGMTPNQALDEIADQEDMDDGEEE